MAGKKAPYTFPHYTRTKRANYIANGQRAYFCRDGIFPLSYNVKVYNCDSSFEKLWERCGTEYLPGGVTEAEYKAFAEARYKDMVNDSTLFQWGLESAWESVQNSDTYRVIWNREETYAVTFGLYGRSGGHLCVETFMGHDLRLTPHELEQYLRSRDCISDEELKALYMLARQWEQDFTSKNASDEVQYQMAFHFFVNVVNPAWEEHVKTEREHSVLVRHARNLHGFIFREEAKAPAALETSFSALCRAAGVLEGEVRG